MTSCRFYRAGNCKFGATCRFVHSEAAEAEAESELVFIDQASPLLNAMKASELSEGGGESSEMLMTRKTICRYFEAGTLCPYGELCYFKHAHRDVKKASAKVEDESCSICFETIIKFGLLPGCDHMFCLSCVVNWRAQAATTLSKSDRDSKRSCPLCREHSDFAIPSYKCFKGAEKAQFIADVLADRARTPCKEYSATQHCKFGGHCFFSHTDINGKDVKPKQLEDEKEQRERRVHRARARERTRREIVLDDDMLEIFRQLIESNVFQYSDDDHDSDSDSMEPF